MVYFSIYVFNYEGIYLNKENQTGVYESSRSVEDWEREAVNWKRGKTGSEKILGKENWNRYFKGERRPNPVRRK